MTAKKSASIITAQLITNKGYKMQIVKKISIKSIVGNVRKIAREWMSGKNQNKIKEKELMIIVGVVGKIQTGENDAGEWLCFTGQIKAINLLDKKYYESKKVFLPEPALKMVKSGIEKFGIVEFAIKVSIAESNKNKQGFIYIIDILIAPEKHDPLKAIESKLGDSIKQKTITFKKPKEAKKTTIEKMVDLKNVKEK